jgi:long-chain acyl-CoA synthetase
MADELSSPPGRVVARLARQLELAVATADLTLSQYRVLGILGDGREAASALAYKLAVSRPSITGVIDGLVARGLVTRDHDALDRRRIGLDLTVEGKRLMALADDEVDRRLGEIAAFAAGGEEQAYAGLDAWQVALDGFLAHRLCTRQNAAAAAADADARAGVAT